MQGARNCEDNPGTYSMPIKVFDKVFSQCPLQYVDSDLIDVVQVVYTCEGGGLGGNRILPSVLLEETAYYFNVRNIVFSEQRRIEKYKDKNQKKEK